MSKSHLRKIVVDGNTYSWYLRHQHLDNGSICIEVLTVYLRGYKTSPLKIRFISDEHWSMGYPKSGVLWKRRQNADFQDQINLNRPAVVATLIQYLRRHQWNPTELNSPLEIEQGLYLLNVVNLPCQ